MPATLITEPSAYTARTSTTLRWFGLSVAVVISALTPRSSAIDGAFTNVTWSSITDENSPRNAESFSTATSSEASSPRTSTDNEVGSCSETAPISTPSLRTTSSHGATSSLTTPPPTLTASGTNSPARASCTLAATSVPARSCASLVEAPRCGVTTTWSSSNSGLSVHGSVENTSRPAPQT
ncbi:Uncharacterised protein [Mycobacteroides abscessus subsp. abscessus]|nr:Uncharacterised protein [Mycobacteroides abscessus subsp. abscessus]